MKYRGVFLGHLSAVNFVVGDFARGDFVLGDFDGGGGVDGVSTKKTKKQNFTLFFLIKFFLYNNCLSIFGKIKYYDVYYIFTIYYHVNKELNLVALPQCPKFPIN